MILKKKKKNEKNQNEKKIKNIKISFYMNELEIKNYQIYL